MPKLKINTSPVLSENDIEIQRTFAIEEKVKFCRVLIIGDSRVTCFKSLYITKYLGMSVSWISLENAKMIDLPRLLETVDLMSIDVMVMFMFHGDVSEGGKDWCRALYVDSIYANFLVRIAIDFIRQVTCINKNLKVIWTNPILLDFYMYNIKDFKPSIDDYTRYYESIKLLTIEWQAQEQEECLNNCFQLTSLNDFVYNFKQSQNITNTMEGSQLNMKKMKNLFQDSMDLLIDGFHFTETGMTEIVKHMSFSIVNKSILFNESSVNLKPTLPRSKSHTNWKPTSDISSSLGKSRISSGSIKNTSSSSSCKPFKNRFNFSSTKKHSRLFSAFHHHNKSCKKKSSMKNIDVQVENDIFNPSSKSKNVKVSKYLRERFEIQCNVYRQKPETHPLFSVEYEKFKKEKLAANKWDEYWAAKLENIFTENWEDNKKSLTLEYLNKKQNISQIEQNEGQSLIVLHDSDLDSDEIIGDTEFLDGLNELCNSKLVFNDQENQPINESFATMNVTQRSLNKEVTQCFPNKEVTQCFPNKEVTQCFPNKEVTPCFSTEGMDQDSPTIKASQLTDRDIKEQYISVLELLSRISKRLGPIGQSIDALYDKCRNEKEENFAIDNEANKLLTLVNSKINSLLNGDFSEVLMAIFIEVSRNLKVLLNNLRLKYNKYAVINIHNIASDNIGKSSQIITEVIKDSLINNGFRDFSADDVLYLYMSVKNIKNDMETQSTSRDRV